jgi:hypothetical protein
VELDKEVSFAARISIRVMHELLRRHVPPHVSFVAGRDRSSDESAARIDATRFDPDDDERLWTGNVVIEAGSEWEGCGDGAQAHAGERLNRNFSYWEILGVDLIFATSASC